MNETKKPKVNSAGERELERAAEQLKEFESQVKELTMDRMNLAPKQEVEPQTKMAMSEIDKSKNIYLKPQKSIGTPQKFNEKFRESYEFDKEYVQFIAENKEIVGENIEIWTRPYGGMPAEYWEVPTNKPVWGPRYLAEQIRRKYYHRMKTEDKVVGSDSVGTMYGQMVVDTTIPRLTAEPVSSKRSVFMGNSGF